MIVLLFKLYGISDLSKNSVLCCQVNEHRLVRVVEAPAYKFAMIGPYLVLCVLFVAGVRQDPRKKGCSSHGIWTPGFRLNHFPRLMR
jgi:hypothetical protein